MGLIACGHQTHTLRILCPMRNFSLSLKPPSYTPPKVRNIILGILICGLCLVFIGYLADFTKWCGYVMLYLPARLGMLSQVSPSQIQTTDFSTSPTEIYFSTPGTYVVYTAHLDLLMISDRILEEGFQPWLRILQIYNGQEVKIETIDRGLMPYDTPFAKGRPIYFFKISQAGKYQMLHPTYPGAKVAFAQYEFHHNEVTSRSVLVIEVLFLFVLSATIYYHHLVNSRSKRLSLQNQNRQRAEVLFEAIRNRYKE